jgi:hypothetical protein
MFCELVDIEEKTTGQASYLSVYQLAVAVILAKSNGIVFWVSFLFLEKRRERSSANPVFDGSCTYS